MPYCPLCKRQRKICVIKWMHSWPRCEVCLLKLPAPKYALKALGVWVNIPILAHNQSTLD